MATAEPESPASIEHLMEAICAPDNIGAALNAVDDGATVFRHCLGCEGIVSKRRDAPYRSGRTKTWLTRP